jgi:hypothetical protein
VIGTSRAALLGAAGAAGGGGYHAPAVHFDGATDIANASLTATDTNFVAFSYWINVANPAGDFPTPWSRPATLENDHYLGDDGAGNWAPNLSLTGTGGVAGFTTGGTSPIAQSTWVHVLAAFDTTNGFGTRVSKLYINDIAVAMPDVSGSGLGFLIQLAGVALTVGSDSYSDDFVVGDMADFWLSNQNILVAGDIPLATRRKFISAAGKPVDPSGFPAGLVLLSGDATTFATNQGSGGAFTTTGTLTNASTSPSD